VQELVRFYRAYGFLEEDAWRIPLRAYVHERRRLEAALEGLPALLNVTHPEGLANFQRRFRDFAADSESRELVTFRFDEDPVQKDRAITDGAGRPLRTDPNGLCEGTITLSRQEADALVERQGSRDGWLTFRSTSKGHEGVGQVQLVPPTGVSVVSDIDDTVKETHIPAGAKEVLQNTFFRPFVAAAAMADMYRAMDGAVFHYVSGGPFQLYEPIAEFLFGTDAGFPAGTLHMKVITKDLLSLSTWDAISRLLINPDATFAHKTQEISRLMRHFPGRSFVLIGDSGEHDPEVYAHVRKEFGAQVQEIRIRDVIDDRTNNPSRLEGMTIIPAPTIGSAQHT
jgi:hypothetical protein